MISDPLDQKVNELELTPDCPESSVSALRLNRRDLLTLTYVSGGTSLLQASAVAHADARRMRSETLNSAVAAVAGASNAPSPVLKAPMANLQQAVQTGFVPLNSTLSFGAASDIASGWDGTLWAIDGAGAPHLYDPLSDTWQLHGAGVDAAALITDSGPAVYFKGGEAFIADGSGRGALAIGLLRLLAAAPATPAGSFRQLLFVNGGSSVGGIDTSANSVRYYDLPGSGTGQVGTGFGYANGVLWFGDQSANLYGVDDQPKIVQNTPLRLATDANASIRSTPVPYTDTQGESVVLVGVMFADVPGLLAFDPTSGNVSTVPTQGTI